MSELLEIILKHQPRTIGIDGKSGSGKTSLAHFLCSKLNGEVIPCDFFHKWERNAWSQQKDLADFEDWSAIQDVLATLLRGEAVVRDHLYEYVTGTHIRTHRFLPKKVLIVEGLGCLNLELDFKIFIDVDFTVAHDRAKNRNIRERGQSEETWPTFQRLFHGEYHKMIPHLKSKADFILNTTQSFPFPKQTETSYRQA